MLLDMHNKWHSDNPFPWIPNNPDSRSGSLRNPWPGRDHNYGSKFLTMHRTMLGEFDQWRISNGYKKVIAWNPSTQIPANVPHPNRDTNKPNLPLKSWFKKKGGTSREPVTGNKKLGDFVDSNQLGTIITWWHNAVHGAIGGDMGRTDRAPA